jgi:hypothetical protein
VPTMAAGSPAFRSAWMLVWANYSSTRYASPMQPWHPDRFFSVALDLAYYAAGGA